MLQMPFNHRVCSAIPTTLTASCSFLNGIVDGKGVDEPFTHCSPCRRRSQSPGIVVVGKASRHESKVPRSCHRTKKKCMHVPHHNMSANASIPERFNRNISATTKGRTHVSRLLSKQKTCCTKNAPYSTPVLLRNHGPPSVATLHSPMDKKGRPRNR